MRISPSLLLQIFVNNVSCLIKYSKLIGEHDDNEVVLRLQKDEISAFDTLYWKYHAAIYANALRLLKKPAIAEDIVQEVFIALWEKRHSLRTDKSVAGWLFVISYNKSISELRHNLKVDTEKSSAEKLFSKESQTEEIKNAQWEVLEKGIEQLSPQKKKVVELCKLQGKTYEQTALELGISKHTVKEYLSDAMAILKNYVSKHSEQYALLVTGSLVANLFS